MGILDLVNEAALRLGAGTAVSKWSGKLVRIDFKEVVTFVQRVRTTADFNRLGSEISVEVTSKTAKVLSVSMSISSALRRRVFGGSGTALSETTASVASSCIESMESSEALQAGALKEIP